MDFFNKASKALDDFSNNVNRGLDAAEKGFQVVDDKARQVEQKVDQAGRKLDAISKKVNKQDSSNGQH